MRIGINVTLSDTLNHNDEQIPLQVELPNDLGMPLPAADVKSALLQTISLHLGSLLDAGLSALAKERATAIEASDKRKAVAEAEAAKKKAEAEAAEAKRKAAAKKRGAQQGKDTPQEQGAEKGSK
jgi:hypothetical protein